MNNVLHLLLLMLIQSLGDIFLSKGMKQFGEITFNFPTQIKCIVYVFTTPWIGLGVCPLVRRIDS